MDTVSHFKLLNKGLLILSCWWGYLAVLNYPSDSTECELKISKSIGWCGSTPCCQTCGNATPALCTLCTLVFMPEGNPSLSTVWGALFKATILALELFLEHQITKSKKIFLIIMNKSIAEASKCMSRCELPSTEIFMALHTTFHCLMTMKFLFSLSLP